MRVPHPLIVLASIGVVAVATAFNMPVAEHWSQSAESFVRESSQSTHLLVQEPSRRSSKRPQLGNSLQFGNQRSSLQMLSAFRDAIGTTWRSTVDLVVDDERVAYGAVVDKDGWIITKDSQIPRDERLVCRFSDGNEALAEIKERNSSLDIALLRVPMRDLNVIEWADVALPQRGNWVATTDTHATPVAVGVVSAGVLSVSAKKAVLGVKLKDSKPAEGALIEEVVRGTGADLAGLRAGDRIRAIDGRQLSDYHAALKVLGSCTPGQMIRLALFAVTMKWKPVFN